MTDRNRSDRDFRFVTPKPAAEVDDELRFHLEERIQANIANGMSPEDARRAALQRFGNVDGVRDECAQMLSEERKADARRDWLDDLRQDIRFAGRSALRAASSACRSTTDAIGGCRGKGGLECAGTDWLEHDFTRRAILSGCHEPFTRQCNDRCALEAFDGVGRRGPIETAVQCVRINEDHVEIGVGRRRLEFGGHQIDAPAGK